MADLRMGLAPTPATPPLGGGLHSGDIILEPPAGADVAQNGGLAPEYMFVEQLPQHENVSGSGSVSYSPFVEQIQGNVAGAGSRFETRCPTGKWRRSQILITSSSEAPVTSMPPLVCRILLS